MSSIPAIALPVISRGDMLERCLLSIDYPVDRLVVFVNSDDPSLTKALERVNNPQIKKLIIQHRLEFGRGCAPAINEVVKAFPEGPYWMLVGADNYFDSGVLQKIDAYCRANTDKLVIWADDVIPILTLGGVKKIGLLDENIYPCYFEDADYAYRVKLMGESMGGVPDIQVGHGSLVVRGNVTTNTDLDLKFKNEISFTLNAEYYKDKWGGAPGEEKFLTPFNLPGCPLSFWSFQPERRVNRLWEKMGENLAENRRKFVVSYINYVLEKTEVRLQDFKKSGTSNDFYEWRVGIVSLARHLSAVPIDCLEHCWCDSLQRVFASFVDPNLIRLAIENETEIERATLSDLIELLGTKFDLQARLAILLLTGAATPLQEIERPSWLQVS